MTQVLEPVTWDTQSLTELKFFRGECPDTLACVFDACSTRALPDGGVLLEPGQRNDELFVVLEGELASGSHTTAKIFRHRNGTIPLAKCRCWTAPTLQRGLIAQTDCEVLVLDAEHLWSVLTHSHLVVLNVRSILSARVRGDNHPLDRNQQLKSAYEYHARVDALTGLNNRHWLDATMACMARRGHVDGQLLCLVMIDIDHFKPYQVAHWRANPKLYRTRCKTGSLRMT